MTNTMDAQELSNALHERAEQASDLRRYEEAKDLAEQAIGANPSDPNGYGSLGRANIGLSDPKQAEKCFRQALSMEPQNPWFLRGVAIALRLRKKHKKALGFIEECLQFEPNESVNHRERGYCMEALGKHHQAERAFKHAVELDPNLVTTHRALADFLLDRRRYVEAERSYRTALELDPTNARVLNNLGVALERQERTEEAAVFYKQAVEFDPTMEVAKSNTKSAVERLTTPGSIGVWIFVIVLVRGLIQAFSEDEQLGNVIVVAILAVALPTVLFLRHNKRRKAEAKLSSLDPDLIPMYRRIKRFK